MIKELYNSFWEAVSIRTHYISHIIGETMTPYKVGLMYNQRAIAVSVVLVVAATIMVSIASMPVASSTYQSTTDLPPMETIQYSKVVSQFADVKLVNVKHIPVKLSDTPIKELYDPTNDLKTILETPPETGNLIFPFSAHVTGLEYTEEVNCLALNIYYEARSEPMRGRYAVAVVTMNRVASVHYPNTVCQVVWEKKYKRYKHKAGGRYIPQFSWTLDGRPDTPPDTKHWRLAKQVALYFYHYYAPQLGVGGNDSADVMGDHMSEEQMKYLEQQYKKRQEQFMTHLGLPTKMVGAHYYHANYVNPRWGRNKRKQNKLIAQVGLHIFYE